MSILDSLIEKAQELKKDLVLPEGQDSRVVKAANDILDKGIARSVTVLGTEEEIKESCEKANIEKRKFNTEDHTSSDKISDYANTLQEIRAKKGKDISKEEAMEKMKNRLFFGAMMARNEEVDGMVAGSIASTGDMLRSAFTVIGTTPGINTGSSSFLMDLEKPAPNGEKSLLFADCAVVPEPDAETLVDIALATVDTHKALIGTKPKVAFLSFSTKGSAQHPIVDKVAKASELMKEKVKEKNLDIVVDGELQADSAIVPKVASSKCYDSPLEGNANILIFPDLNAGNICYKLTQRLAGSGAFGPVLQGLAKPVNDLSRGCAAEDIVGVAAITACQSGSK